MDNHPSDHVSILAEERVVGDFGGHRDCLLRLVENADNKSYIIIFSQLYSEQKTVGIDFCFDALIKLTLGKFAFLQDDLTNVVWLKHYGQFSYPNSFENEHMRDSFVQVYPGYEHEASNEKVLNANELKALLGDIQHTLPSVEAVVRSHHRNSKV